ncbi:MAG: redoxin domain-containing protein [Candidatus Aminicenantales bacterium]
MKKINVLFLLIVLVLSFCGGEKTGGKFTFVPAKPTPGEKIKVIYDPQGTGLEEAASIEMVAYSYTRGLPKAASVFLEKEGKKWKGSFFTDKESRGVVVKFQSEHIVDNNNKKGYVIALYDENKNMVPGSLAGLAEAALSWGSYFLEMERDEESAFEKFEKEFSLHPEMKREYLSPYLGLLMKLKKDEGRAMAEKELEALATEDDFSLDELSLLVSMYRRLGEPDKAEKYALIIRERAPDGQFVQGERFREFYMTEDIERKIELFEKFKKDFPESSMIPQFLYYIQQYYLAEKDYRSLADYIRKNLDIADWSVLNSAAWDLSQRNAELASAELFASKAVEDARQELESARSEKLPYLTEKEWENQRKNTLGQILDTYGFVLSKLEKESEALSAFEEAVELTEGKNPEINERYSEALVKNSPPERALSEIGKYIEQGNSTSRMKELLKEAFVKEKGSEQGFPQFLEKLEAVALKKMRESLEREMINFPAANFSLEDLEGNTVSLADLKGKVVVLDFWATWCGPCKRSFPGMKMAVEKYKDDKSVEFLFINSWERVDNKRGNAQQFIAWNNYPFHVLLDSENKVIEAYKVEGIPTKFIIDPRGRVRFKKVGFAGSTEKMVNELSVMIEMVR